MKVRDGFVSNSSSTTFIITNKTKGTLKVSDFVKENPQLIKQFNEEYPHCGGYDQESLLNSALENDKDLSPGSNHCTFGDEQGTVIGEVFDYILRDGGSSKRFSWKFEEYNR